jgi:DNA-binding SARP family transcriptional activator
MTMDYSSTPTVMLLLDGFDLRRRGASIAIPLGAQRLLAFLAVRKRPQLRSHVAAMLWLDSTEEHSQASLRSMLWRVRRCAGELILATGQQLRLHPGLQVDLHAAECLAHDILASPAVAVSESVAFDSLCQDLLPHWYDDWVLLEREHFRQLRLHALDTLSEQLVRAGAVPRALEAALAAVEADPLRESANRALIGVHLAEGNTAEALRQFQHYRVLLRDELGLQPSERMRSLVRAL